MPETKLVGSYPIQLLLEQVKNGYRLQVHLSKLNNHAPIKDDEVVSRVLDADSKQMTVTKASSVEQVYVEAQSASTTANGM